MEIGDGMMCFREWAAMVLAVLAVIILFSKTDGEA